MVSAAVIAVAWDTQMSPGDVRALRASQMATAERLEKLFFTARGKTGPLKNGARDGTRTRGLRRDRAAL
jgi:hypothetical protein